MQVPPALNRFTKTADKNLAETVFKLLLKYRPEDKAAKKARLLREVRGCSKLYVASSYLPALSGQKGSPCLCMAHCAQQAPVSQAVTRRLFNRQYRDGNP